MPFDYYRRLTKKQRRIYDASDAVPRVELSDARPAERARGELEAALAAEDKRAVGRAAQALASAICDDRGIPRPVVRVLAKRPKDDQAELHGLYVREEDAPAVIRVWMRTAERRQVVRPRTFVRTLLHELVHHLDYELLELEDSFHTQGFYRREASLLRLVGGAASPERAVAPKSRAPGRAADPVAPVQLSLFGDAPLQRERGADAGTGPSSVQR